MCTYIRERESFYYIILTIKKYYFGTQRSDIVSKMSRVTFFWIDMLISNPKIVFRNFY